MQAKGKYQRILSKEKMDEIKKTGDQKWQVYLAAIQYIEAGCFVLPLMPNNKAIPYKDYSINYGSASRNRDTIDKWFHPNEGRFAGWNIGIATGRDDGVFAIDIDVHGDKDGWANIQAVMEEVGGTLGDGPIQRTPSGGYHYLYIWQDNAASSTNKIAESVDTRGGVENSCKGHIVAFPSTINGKGYEWIQGGEIGHIPPWVMEKMGVTWRPPSNRGGRGNENIGGDDIEVQVPLDQVKRMLDNIDIEELSYEGWLRIGMAIKSQYPGDDGLEVWDEWSKKGKRYKPNECQTRWYGFSDAGEVRIGTLYYHAQSHGWTPLEDDAKANKYDVLVERMNQTYAVVPIGGKIRILREKPVVSDPVIGHYELLHKEDFRTLLMNETVILADSRGNPKKVTIADVWLAHQARRTYPNGIGLFPRMKAPDGWYNTWDGFSVKPRPGSCNLLLNHIKEVICNGNDYHYNWLLDWCADCVQDPANPKGTAIVMRGDEGTGKGTLANTIGELFGPHYRHLIDDSHLLNNFNAHMIDALFVFADEITWGGNIKSAGKLKGMVTEKYLVGERKGVDAIGYRNMTHIMIASNNDWVVPAGANSRRWFVLDVNDRHMQDTSYFGPIKDELANGGLEAFLHLLLERKIENDLHTAPRTEALNEQRVRSMSNDTLMQWWINRVERGVLQVPSLKEFDPDNVTEGWPQYVLKPDLYDDYREWCTDDNVRSMSINIFYAEVKKLGLSVSRPRVQGERVQVYSIPPLDEAKAFLKKKYGVDLQEEDKDEVSRDDT